MMASVQLSNRRENRVSNTIQQNRGGQHYSGGTPATRSPWRALVPHAQLVQSPDCQTNQDRVEATRQRTCDDGTRHKSPGLGLSKGQPRRRKPPTPAVRSPPRLNPHRSPELYPPPVMMKQSRDVPRPWGCPSLGRGAQTHATRAALAPRCSRSPLASQWASEWERERCVHMGCTARGQFIHIDGQSGRRTLYHSCSLSTPQRAAPYTRPARSAWVYPAFQRSLAHEDPSPCLAPSGDGTSAPGREHSPPCAGSHDTSPRRGRGMLKLVDLLAPAPVSLAASSSEREAASFPAEQPGPDAVPVLTPQSPTNARGWSFYSFDVRAYRSRRT